MSFDKQYEDILNYCRQKGYDYPLQLLSETFWRKGAYAEQEYLMKMIREHVYNGSVYSLCHELKYMCKYPVVENYIIKSLQDMYPDLDVLSMHLRDNMFLLEKIKPNDERLIGWSKHFQHEDLDKDVGGQNYIEGDYDNEQFWEVFQLAFPVDDDRDIAFSIDTYGGKGMDFYEVKKGFDIAYCREFVNGPRGNYRCDLPMFEAVKKVLTAYYQVIEPVGNIEIVYNEETGRATWGPKEGS